MRQVFRLMGMPDKVIAFDELPERFLQGFELCKAEGFPRHWKEWLGKSKNVIKVPPEMDVFTKQVRKFDPIVEEDCFFYLVDWNLGPVVQRWQDICDFVRRVVPKDFRLAEKIDSMALPLASNKTDSVTLEPEDVVVIPIPLEFQEKKDNIVSKPEVDKLKEELESKNVPRGIVVKCETEGCDFEAEGKYAKNSLRMHMKKHQVKATA